MLEEENGRLETVDPSGLRIRPSKSAADYAAAHWDEIRRLDLVDNIAELEANGLTVVAPSKVADAAFVTRLRDAVIAVTERRTGEPVDVAGTTEAVYAGGFGRQM